jgi:hypothetical protein
MDFVADIKRIWREGHTYVRLVMIFIAAMGSVTLVVALEMGNWRRRLAKLLSPFPLAQTLLYTTPVLYFFLSDYSPLYHRKLFRYGKRRWEKGVNLFRRLGLMPHRKGPRLPPEIWERILEFVVEIPLAFDPTCNDPKDFYQFIESRSYDTKTYHALYMKSEEERTNLRLVCRMWAELMQNTYRWAGHIRRKDLLMKKIRGVRRLDVCISYRPSNEPWHKKRSTPTTLIDLRRELASIQRMPLSTLCIHFPPDQVLQFNDPMYEGMDRINVQSILEKVQDIRSIRSLTFTNEHEKSSQLLSQIQRGYFTHLTTLFIQAAELSGPLRLDQLEVLYFDIRVYHPDKWWFPALQHCAIGPTVPGRNGRGAAFDASLIPAPTEQLLSLYFPNQRMLSCFNDVFWTQFPRLEFLGGDYMRWRFGT